MPVTSCSSTEEVAQVSLQLGNSQIWESLQAKKIHEYTNLKLKKYINTQTYKYKQAQRGGICVSALYELSPANMAQQYFRMQKNTQMFHC